MTDELGCRWTAEKRLEIIARVIRDRGFYAMGPSDAQAIETVLAKAAGQAAEPVPDDELVQIVRAFAAAGWCLSRT